MAMLQPCQWFIKAKLLLFLLNSAVKLARSHAARVQTIEWPALGCPKFWSYLYKFLGQWWCLGVALIIDLVWNLGAQIIGQCQLWICQLLSRGLSFTRKSGPTIIAWCHLKRCLIVTRCSSRLAKLRRALMTLNLAKCFWLRLALGSLKTWLGWKLSIKFHKI